MKRSFFLPAAALLLSSRRTMQGLRRDMQRAGNSIEDRAAR
jgi:predicted small secreted protein